MSITEPPTEGPMSSPVSDAHKVAAARYAAHKAAGICPGHPGRRVMPGYARCAECLDHFTLPATRDHMRVVRAAQPHTMDRAALREYTGPQIAHCGAWHDVTALPFICPTCHTTVLSEDVLCPTHTP